MSNVSEQQIVELRNDYLVKKKLFEQANMKNEQSVQQIQQILASITAEELKAAEEAGVNLSEILNIDVDRLKVDIELYNRFHEQLDAAIDIVFNDAKSKLGDVL